MYPGFLRSLGKCATREELESLQQELESVSRNFDFSAFFWRFLAYYHQRTHKPGASGSHGGPNAPKNEPHASSIGLGHIYRSWPFRMSISSVVVVVVVVVVIIVVVVVLPWSSCRVVGCVGSVDGVEGGGALSMGVWH